MIDYLRAVLGGRRPKTADEAKAMLAAQEARWARRLARSAAVDMLMDEDAAVPLLEAQLEANRAMREHARESRARTVGDRK